MRKPTIWLLALSFLAFFFPSLSAQDATGSITGNVICNDGNTPGRGAKVTLVPLDRLLSQKPDSESQGAGSTATVSDFNGAYELSSVRPDTYVVNASLDGYSDDLKLTLSVLASFSLEDREKILAAFPHVIVKPGASAHKDLVLRRAAAISGRVSVDLGGVPGRIAVTATRVSAEDSEIGSMAQIKKSPPFTQSSMIDDRGVYRIAGLPAGKYQVSVRITEAYFRASVSKSGGVRLEPERSGTAELTVYAPESLNVADARVIEVKDADEITDADITVPTRILHSIGGMVTDGGAPRSGIIISIQRQGSPVQPSTAVTMGDGSYRFDLLPSGAYTLRVLQAGASTTIPGRASVQLVDSDILDANIELRSKSAPAP